MRLDDINYCNVYYNIVGFSCGGGGLLAGNDLCSKLYCRTLQSQIENACNKKIKRSETWKRIHKKKTTFRESVHCTSEVFKLAGHYIISLFWWMRDFLYVHNTMSSSQGKSEWNSSATRFVVCPFTVLHVVTTRIRHSNGLKIINMIIIIRAYDVTLYPKKPCVKVLIVLIRIWFKYAMSIKSNIGTFRSSKNKSSVIVLYSTATIILYNRTLPCRLIKINVPNNKNIRNYSHLHYN